MMSLRIKISLTVWLFVLVGVFSVAHFYGLNPGKQTSLQKSIPSSMEFKLKLFLHPKCPCSRATLIELNKIQANIGDNPKLKTEVWFFYPEELSPSQLRSWNDTAIYRMAEGNPKLTVHLDPGGSEAKSYGAFTSGQTYLYHPDGHLLYSGGLTASRGHEGPNLGAEFISATVSGKKIPSQVESLIVDGALKLKTFGCGLFKLSEKKETSKN